MISTQNDRVTIPTWKQKNRSIARMIRPKQDQNPVRKASNPTAPCLASGPADVTLGLHQDLVAQFLRLLHCCPPRTACNHVTFLLGQFHPVHAAFISRCPLALLAVIFWCFHCNLDFTFRDYQWPLRPLYRGSDQATHSLAWALSWSWEAVFLDPLILPLFISVKPGLWEWHCQILLPLKMKPDSLWTTALSASGCWPSTNTSTWPPRLTITL